MRAVWLDEVGPPDRLTPGDAPEPAPAAGDALIDVAFASVTFVETQLRAGRGPFQLDLPTIPGNGVGGVVASVGSPDDAMLVGRRVVASLGGSGGYAERAVVPVDALIAVPDGVGLDAATALLADGRTATALIRLAVPRAGERVLVEAAAGGVGSLLVQLARSGGASVVAAAGGERKLALARKLGADTTVDYTRPDWPGAAGTMDVVFDGVGGAIARAAFGLLQPGGRMLSYGLASGRWSDVTDAEAQERGVSLRRPQRPDPAQQRGDTATALAEAAAGRLRSVIGQRVPLAEAARAHAAIEARETIGKTLLVV